LLLVAMTCPPVMEFRVAGGAQLIACTGKLATIIIGKATDTRSGQTKSVSKPNHTIPVLL